MHKIICPYPVSVNDLTLCMLYSKFSIDGRCWSNYPDCNEENCPLLHPELLGNMVWNKDDSR